MRNVAFGFVALIAGVLVLTPGCGDDEESADGASGGEAGEGSTGDGGTSSGGTSSGKGGTGSGGTNTGSGGSTSSAGGAPAGGEGGGGAGTGPVNPAGCPATAPASNDDCFIDLDLAETCQYPGSTCVCNGYTDTGAGGAPNPGNWVCFGGGEDCPDTAPATDDDCSDNGLSCPYPGGISCFCQGGDWTCDDPGQGAGGVGNVPGECPDTAPADNAACNGGIYGCLYEEDDVLCNCPAVGPNSDHWNCQDI
jgi:hypothetical protein